MRAHESPGPDRQAAAQRRGTGTARTPNPLLALQQQAGNSAVVSVQRGREKGRAKAATATANDAPDRSDSGTWRMNAVEFLNKVDRSQVDASNIRDLDDKVLSGNMKTRNKMRPVLNFAMHTHNGDGGGISFAYRTEANNTVTPVVFDIAFKRQGNSYTWEKGGKGPATSNAEWY